MIIFLLENLHFFLDETNSNVCIFLLSKAICAFFFYFAATVLAVQFLHMSCYLHYCCTLGSVPVASVLKFDESPGGTNRQTISCIQSRVQDKRDEGFITSQPAFAFPIVTCAAISVAFFHQLSLRKCLPTDEWELLTDLDVVIPPRLRRYYKTLQFFFCLIFFRPTKMKVSFGSELHRWQLKCSIHSLHVPDCFLKWGGVGRRGHCVSGVLFFIFYIFFWSTCSVMKSLLISQYS